ncbi:peptidase M6 [Algibacter sp. L1A34]|uniref:peptidase M6 n=1 Tax=Algibacter sp. L1A34 TaxID=2686365 RepID=UPI00131C03D2|nr:peptidase M6 [Algibacter sp. L1A34]
MNFSNKKVLRTYASPHSKNAWANIETLGWRKIGQLSTDGVTNIFIILNVARGNNKTVTGSTDASNLISTLYL